ncbi:Protein of unknown function [Parasphingorhabdus marina DSM 22363]|uniref:DUF3047 domain-containing protein n=1 Tax=Parasphingorhabdus marina DSM 22363 TaxID=1123272 RepID=A0A1N6EJ28_9SPHN|nr:DUF3047 domain-containing protein [Parasphingorhabdus marina]SIN83022.1 Protein of unknown function [Parasphingorhabdus marina DSM 22363]
MKWPSPPLTVRVVIALSLSMGSAPDALAEPLQQISRFDVGTQGWRAVQIDRKVPATRFARKTIDGVPAVEAHARNSMALFTRPVMVDLKKTPVLCWRWRVSNVVKNADITKKSGDDQAARVYVGLDLPNSKLSLGTRAKLAIARSRGGAEIPDGAINYVWDNRLPVGTARKNVFTGQARIIVAQSGSAQAGQWITERHDLARDIQKQFRTDKARITSVAISSDTDNAGGTVTAAFADIHMVGAGARCRF